MSESVAGSESVSIGDAVVFSSVIDWSSRSIHVSLPLRGQ
jgi:hypothetical protein